MPFLDVFFLDFCPQCFLALSWGPVSFLQSEKLAGKKKRSAMQSFALLCFALQSFA
jgi:hypothetical protein